MISWVLDRNILEVLYYRTHCLVIGRRGGRYIDNVQLVKFKLLSSNSNEFSRILRCPEVDVESVKSEEVLSLVARIGVRKSPVMIRLLYRRGCRFIMTTVAVDYDGTQRRVFVGLTHSC